MVISAPTIRTGVVGINRTSSAFLGRRSNQSATPEIASPTAKRRIVYGRLIKLSFSAFFA